MYCPNCGKEIPDGSKFCPYCGYFVTNKKNVEFPNINGKKTKRSKFFLSFLIFLLIGISITSIIFYYSLYPDIKIKKSAQYENKGIEALNSITNENIITNQSPLQEAQTYFEKSIKLNPDNISVRKELITIYLINDDFEKLIKEIDEVLKREPDDLFCKTLKELINEE